MNVDLFQFGVLLRNLQEGCKVAHDVLVESQCPSTLVEPIKNAMQSLDFAASYYLSCLKECASVPSESQTQTKDVKMS